MTVNNETHRDTPCDLERRLQVKLGEKTVPDYGLTDIGCNEEIDRASDAQAETISILAQFIWENNNDS